MMSGEGARRTHGLVVGLDGAELGASALGAAPERVAGGENLGPIPTAFGLGATVPNRLREQGYAVPPAGTRRS